MNKQAIETFRFKRFGDGYVYRAPPAYLFGPSHRHYLVNEAQKVELIKLMKPARPILWAVSFIGAIVAVVGAAVIVAWALSAKDNPGVVETLFIAISGLVSLVLAVQIYMWLQYRRLKPLLDRLPRSDERISNEELLEGVRKNTSIKTSIRIGAINAFVFSCAMFTLGVGVNQLIATGRVPASVYMMGFVAIQSAFVAFTHLRLAMRRAELVEKAV